LTVAVVTKPFAFEGSRKIRIAERGIDELRVCVDTLISVPNSRLLQMVGPQVSVEEAFHLADEALRHGVQGISDIINETGIINRDFADIETVMKGGGIALMGIGTGAGEHRAIEAAQQAFASPLLEEASLEGAQKVLVNFIGGPDTAINEINDAAEYIAKRCAADCLFLFGYGQRSEMQGKIQVTVVATGFGESAQPQPQPTRPVITVGGGGIANQPNNIGQTEVARQDKAKSEPINPYLPANLSSDYGVNVGSFSEFDTPTYLRRQMD
jgi:cell division protein FtsZ